MILILVLLNFPNEISPTSGSRSVEKLKIEFGFWLLHIIKKTKHYLLVGFGVPKLKKQDF